MTFIITFISLIIERFFHWNHLRYWRWFDVYQRAISRRIANWPSYLLLVICILPLMIVAGLIDVILSHWFYGVPRLIFGVLILLYCMGPENLWAQAYACLGELQKDDPKAVVDRAQTAFGITLPENSQAFHQALTRAIFIEANTRIFAVIFWFIILGPAGAIMYRSIAMCAKQSDLGLTQAASVVRKILDWVPARILTFIFALGGHFTEVFQVWKKDIRLGLNGNDQLLGECGIAALDAKKSNQVAENGSAEKEALSLLDRVFIMVLVLLAMIVIMTR